MASINREELNPFQAPTATIGGPSFVGIGTDAEVIRRTYLGHEASVKSIGSLYYINAFFALLGMVGYGLGAVGLYNIPMNNSDPTISPQIVLGLSSGFCLFGVVISAGLGYGLRNLQQWARWIMIVLMGLSLVLLAVMVMALAVMSPAIAAGSLVGGALPGLFVGYIFYLMASAKGSMVFSTEYSEVIRQTPHVKYKTSIIVKVLLGLLVALILFGVVMGIISTVSGR